MIGTNSVGERQQQDCTTLQSEQKLSVGSSPESDLNYQVRKNVDLAYHAKQTHVRFQVAD